MPSIQRATQLVLLAALGVSSAWAHTPMPVSGLLLADAGTPQWKETGPVTRKKQNEVNSGSWQPQAQPQPQVDPEQPLNEGEDSETYDDGDT
ncbi:hypothetical protein VRB78_03715 [Pseudomonas trivialis]|uniref:hypothetical protein n=1 Tax=Pseudomonas trivialis TaxID=200450 RepID=UPI0030CF540B